MSEAIVVADTEHYQVTHYPNVPDAVVVCFTSLAGNAGGEHSEEFRHTLRKLGVSSIHVTTKQRDWFNNEETESVWSQVAQICTDYSSIGITGQSMGASAALPFTRYLSDTSRMRVLVFAPQFSLARPFIEFDERFRGLGAKIAKQIFYDFSSARNVADCQIVFGNTDWRDYLHAAMFVGSGFPVFTVDGGTHEVAAFLRWSPRGNLLQPLLKKFCDFTADFNSASVEETLRPLLGGRLLLEGRATVFGETLKTQRQKRPIPNPPTDFANLALGQKATQSSAAPWAPASKPGDRSSNAVNGIMTGSYAFYTNYENCPWWQVDLGAACEVAEIRLFNNLDDFSLSVRSNFISIDIASDETGPWQTIMERRDALPFGGLDGYPLIWKAEASLTARYVRVRLSTLNCLHLDEVEVYGRVL